MTTQNIELVTTLSLLGLPENEAKVYLATLEIGAGSVWDIAKLSGVKRPTCYVILEKMSAQGLAYRSNDSKKTLFSVVSPSELIATFQQRTKAAEAKLSELQAVASKAAYKPAIRLYEGHAAVKKLYDLAIAESKDEILIYGTKQVVEAFPGYFEQWTLDRIEHDRLLRIIFAETPQNRSLGPYTPENHREPRFLPKEIFDPQQEVVIFGNYIAYVAVLEKQPFATLIESRLFADFERQRFEIMWKIAKK